MKMDCPGCDANLDYIESSRVLIKQDPEKEGIIELRKGVADISLGDRKYAQVRIRVGSTRTYIKGTAIYSDNIPEGYDVIFYIGQELGEDGKIRGWGIDTHKKFKKPMTTVNMEAAWYRWVNSLPLKRKENDYETDTEGQSKTLLGTEQGDDPRTDGDGRRGDRDRRCRSTLHEKGRERASGRT